MTYFVRDVILGPTVLAKTVGPKIMSLIYNLIINYINYIFCRSLNKIDLNKSQTVNMFVTNVNKKNPAFL